MKYFTRSIFIPVVLIVAIIFSISGTNNLPSSIKKASAAGPFVASGLQVFTIPGTFTYNIPANAGRLRISAVGGGGGGSNSFAYATGGGGGGGQYLQDQLFTLTSAQQGTAISVTVGVGGARGAAGANGGNTIVTAFLTARGGQGGRAPTGFIGLCGSNASGVTARGGNGGNGNNQAFYAGGFGGSADINGPIDSGTPGEDGGGSAGVFAGAAGGGGAADIPQCYSLMNGASGGNANGNLGGQAPSGLGGYLSGGGGGASSYPSSPGGRAGAGNASGYVCAGGDGGGYGAGGGGAGTNGAPCFGGNGSGGYLQIEWEIACTIKVSGVVNSGVNASNRNQTGTVVFITGPANYTYTANGTGAVVTSVTEPGLYTVLVSNSFDYLKNININSQAFSSDLVNPANITLTGINSLDNGRSIDCNSANGYVIDFPINYITKPVLDVN